MTSLRNGSSLVVLALAATTVAGAAHAQVTGQNDAPAPSPHAVAPAPTSPAADAGSASGGGAAQPATPAASAPAGASQDIVITAQRRRESIQNVPISLIAVSGDSLERAGITSLAGLPRIAPGLSVGAVSGFVNYTYIRGGGTNQIDPGSDPSVAYFVDEIYIAGNEGLNFDLFDIDHVEVLKGPQGTIFGRNASSGAISVVTRRPTATFQGTAEVEYGSYNSLLARTAISGPLNADGSLRGRISAAYRNRDAVTENLNGGADPGNIDAAGARGQLEWTRGNVDLLLTSSYYRARNGQTNLFLTTPTVAGYVDATLAQPTDQSFYAHYYDFIGFENQNTFDINARAELRTPIGLITSISAYRSNHFIRNQDGDGTKYFASIQDSNERARSFSQELRLVGDATSFLHHTLGVYYYHSNVDFLYYTPKGPANPTVSQRNKSISDGSTYLTDSYAVFGQLRIDFTHQLRLTLGGRYTSDHKSDDRSVNILGNAYTVSPEATFHAFTPAVTLELVPSDNFMAYLSYRRGFKSGGFQSLAPANAGLANIPFQPEFVNSYEAGIRASLFDNRLRASISAFRADITNQQVNRFQSVTVPINGVVTTFNGNVIDNAGRTRDNGVDVSLTARPFRGFTLTANATFQHARFLSYLNPANGLNFTGKQQARSPDFAGYLGADYTFPLGNVGDMSLHGEYSRQSNMYFDPANSTLPGLHQPAYGIGNLNVTLALRQVPLELSAFVRNVGDTHYFTNIAIIGVTGQGIPGLPRMFGGSARLRF